MVDLLSYWSNEGHGECCPLCGVVHIIDPLQIIPYGGDSGFHLAT